MGQPQDGFQHAQQGVAGAATLGGVLVVQFDLGQFQVPVAVAVPDEAVDGVGGQVEAVFGQGLGHFGLGALQFGNDPAVDRAEVHELAGAAVLLAGPGEAVVMAFDVHQHKAGGVPELVAEVAVALAAADVEVEGAREVGQRGEGEAQGVGAEGGDAVGEVLLDVLLDAGLVVGAHEAAHRLGQQGVELDAVDEVERVQGVALGLGHLLAFGIAHDGVDVDVLEGHLAGEVLGHHHHPGHPEEDDVVAGDQHVGRQVAGQVCAGLGVVGGPAQRGEGHQGRREPGVEHVGVLGERAGAAGGVSLLAGFFLVAGHEELPILAVPGGNPVAPPQLARDAPVMDVGEPVVVGGGPVLGEEADAAGGDGFQRRAGDGGHATGAAVGLRLAGLVHEPLVGQHGLDHFAGAAADGHHVAVLDGVDQQAGGVQVGDHAIAGLVAVQAPVGLGHGIARHVGLQVEHDDQRQVVAHGHFVVVEVVGAGDLHAAAAEFGIDVGVGNDGDLTAGERQGQHLAVQVAVALVIGMHGHGHVAQQGLGAGGGHGQARQFGAVSGLLGAVGEGVADVPEVAITLGHVHFQIGDGRAQHRVPVHQPLAAVDEAGFMQAHEDFGHGRGQFRVHGEVAGMRAQAVGVLPVGRVAQPAHLLADGAARFVLPGPDALDELLARQVVARLALGGQLALDDDLRGDAGVVAAHHPVGVLAQHPVVADERVHQGLLERMAHVQRAGDVGRRQLDAVGGVAGRLGGCRAGGVGTRGRPVGEVAARFPQGIPARLDGRRLETLGQLVLGGIRRGSSVGHERVWMEVIG